MREITNKVVVGLSRNQSSLPPGFVTTLQNKVSCICYIAHNQNNYSVVVGRVPDALHMIYIWAMEDVEVALITMGGGGGDGGTLISDI